MFGCFAAMKKIQGESKKAISGQYLNGYSALFGRHEAVALDMAAMGFARPPSAAGTVQHLCIIHMIRAPVAV